MNELNTYCSACHGGVQGAITTRTEPYHSVARNTIYLRGRRDNDFCARIPILSFLYLDTSALLAHASTGPRSPTDFGAAQTPTTDARKEDAHASAVLAGSPSPGA